MSHPNLIYVFADQLRWASVGYNGDTLAETPNIDDLARDSADITNAVSGHPVCAPYRASLLTGKYTTSTGMVINEIRMNPHHKCFAHVLNDAGYDSSYIGKWHLYAAQLGHHYDPENSFVPPGEDRLTATSRRIISTTNTTRRRRTTTWIPRKKSMPKATNPIL